MKNGQIVFMALGLYGMLITPILLVWGWIRWSKNKQSPTVFSRLTLAGFSLASASAGLALTTLVTAGVRPFPFYDPLLLKIYDAGLLLALGGLLVAFLGFGRSSTLRWHAPICAGGMLCFWLVMMISK